MTDVVLPYNRDSVPQETGYWCGPASTQIVLDTRGIHFTEQDLAAQCGTTVNGTDYIGQITAVLNNHIHDAEYITVDLRDDPPTQAQVEQFWRDLRMSIDAGFGVVMNFISPANNPPRPVKGSGPAPNFYGSSTIYHYTTAMGWSDDPSRSVWVGDPGGAPFGYWITLEQAVLLCAGKGYSYARPKAAPGVPIPAGPEDAALLSYAMGDALPIERYRELVPAVKDALARSNCTTPQRVAQWMAQVGHESGGLKYQEEIADGSAYEGRADLGNVHPGDGPKYKGHGWLQITGYTNHEQVSQWAYGQQLVPSATYFLEFPAELGSDRYAGMGAAWYWTVARPAINGMADAEDHEGVCRAINGGLNGYDDRVARYGRCLEVASAFVPAAPPPAAAPAAPPPPPAPAPAPAPAPVKEPTCLTGRPHHHSENAPTDQQILDMRAEGMLTQALVYAIAEKLGLDAHKIYTDVRAGF